MSRKPMRSTPDGGRAGGGAVTSSKKDGRHQWGGTGGHRFHPSCL